MPDPQLRRVLMTTDTVGGVWTFTLELATGLAERGIEVVLAAMGAEPSAKQASDAARIQGLCLLGSTYKLEWMEDPWADVEQSGRWLMGLQEEYSPDIVHLNSLGHGGLAWRCPVILTVHSCVLSWWSGVRGGQAPREWDRYRAAVRLAIDSADVVTAPSESMAQAVVANYGTAKPRVIYNGVGPGAFSAAAKEPFVFSAGRLWDEAKNVSALAAIASELEWPVYLAGDAGEARFEGCSLLGKLSPAEIANWYGRAAIYALPARYEPFGLSVVEAGLSGCALVLGDIPSLREIWEDAAWFVNPEQPGELRQALSELIASAPLREEMSRRSRRRALTFDAAQTTSAYVDIYRSAVASGTRQCVS